MRLSEAQRALLLDMVDGGPAVHRLYPGTMKIIHRIENTDRFWEKCVSRGLFRKFGKEMYILTPLGFDERERIKQESAGVELGAGGKWLAERERLGGGK